MAPDQIFAGGLCGQAAKPQAAAGGCARAQRDQSQGHSSTSHLKEVPIMGKDVIQMEDTLLANQHLFSIAWNNQGGL